jgi:hypothetical protein
MSCWRFDLKRRLLTYLEGRLDAPRVARLERHLVDCEECRQFLVRLRAGHSLAQRLARVPPIDVTLPRLSFPIGHPEMSSRPSRRFRLVRRWSDRMVTPQVVTGLAALVILQTALLLVSNRGLVFGERPRASASTHALDLDKYRLLKIRELRSNNQPHVATDGYVEDVHTDEEEGTVAFKLVESRGASNSFVVCEIVAPLQMATPQQGSHVRVYGVARYDAQADRMWYEVNPVFEIASLSP